MEISTAERLLPRLPPIHSTSTSPRLRPRRHALSPHPINYNVIYQQMVMQEKEFIKGNRFAQQLASRFSTSKTQIITKKKEKTLDLAAELKEYSAFKNVNLGVDGLPVPIKDLQKRELKSILEHYTIGRTWVKGSPKPHRRTASNASAARNLSPLRKSPSPKDPVLRTKTQLTTININLPNIHEKELDFSDWPDSPPLRDSQETTHGFTFDLTLRKSGVRTYKLPVQSIKTISFPSI